MQRDCRNIYQTARKIAGVTQERAAEMLGLSVRSLADYECGVRVPPNEVVDQMVMCYGFQQLAVWHIRATVESARSILPEVAQLRLPEAVLCLVDAVYDFADDKLDRQLIDMARDGAIDETERPQFRRIVGKLNNIVAAAVAISCQSAER